MPLIGRDKVDKAIVDTVITTNDNLKGVYFAGLANIINGTPADTGRARNNWFLSVGTPSNSMTTSKNKAGASSIRQLSKMPDQLLGKKIFFTNNLPYIGTLEYGGFPSPVKLGSWIDGKYQKLSDGGFSKQAPDGWVRSTLIAMKNKIGKL